MAALGADTSCEVRGSPPRPAKLCCFPRELSRVPFGAGAAWSQPGPGPVSWALPEPPQVTARGALARCHHMRDRE